MSREGIPLMEKAQPRELHQAEIIHNFQSVTGHHSEAIKEPERPLEERTKQPQQCSKVSRRNEIIILGFILGIMSLIIVALVCIVSSSLGKLNKLDLRVSELTANLTTVNEKLTNKLTTVLDLLNNNMTSKSTANNKFIFVSYDWRFYSEHISTDNVEFLDYTFKNQSLLNLLHTASTYKKELLVIAYWKCLYSVAGYERFYKNLLLISQQWKALRPDDGEIHHIGRYDKGETVPTSSNELTSSFSTSYMYLHVRELSWLDATKKQWPKFANIILKNKPKLRENNIE